MVLAGFANLSPKGNNSEFRKYINSEEVILIQVNDADLEYV